MPENRLDETPRIHQRSRGKPTMKRADSARTIVAAAFIGLFPSIALAAPDLALSMSVDVPVPAAGQPVQFTVTLNNVGADPAAAVIVTDQLSAELAIPVGMAAFTSVGTYDAATGAWAVGDMSPGATALLVIPAIVVAPIQPPCSVNSAETRNASDTQTSNNRAVAAVRTSANVVCVDLSINGDTIVWPACDSSRHLESTVYVTNAGPDDAHDVIVDMSQDPAIAPGLHFTSSGCTGLRCTIGTVAAGATVTRLAVSDDFRNMSTRFLTMTFAASSADTDYAMSNNLDEDEVGLPIFNDCSVDVGNVGVGCFIATAAYGSALEPHVLALRTFRDRYLQRTELGRAFIRFYYRHSPPLAAVIAAHPPLRFVARALIAPIVLTIAYPLLTLALVTLAMLILLAWYVSRRRAA
jgi:uncharacterized repeat protein (TIGR01451 family)